MINLESVAMRAHPHSESHRKKWLAAVLHLRAGRGWVADKGVVGFMLPIAKPPEPDIPPKADRVRAVMQVSEFKRKS
jgi:hypothetical protein